MVKAESTNMIDKRIGQRFKECREQAGLTQEALAEKTHLSTNYISTIERGASFPRCERLVTLLNAMEAPADAVFCDVIACSEKYRTSRLDERLAKLPLEAQQRILQTMELLIQQEVNKDL